MSVSTVILSAIILACVVLAVRRLVRKGMCDCHDGACEGCSKKGVAGKASRNGGASAQGGCSCCSAADDMVAKMERAAKS